MRVLYHHRTRAGDAQGIHIAEMQHALRARAHEVEEIALVRSAARVSADGETPEGSGARLADRVARRAPRPLREVLELGYNAVAYRRLLRAMRARRPDLLYERYAAFTIAGVLAARRADVPVMLEVNSPLARERAAHGGLALRRLARACERLACSRADVLLPVSQALADVLLADGVRARRVRVLPNGVRRDFGRGDRARGLAALGLATSDGRLAAGPVIGVVGWFRDWHGLDTLVEAFDAAPMRALGATLVLAGAGPALDALRERLAPLVGAGTVRLAGVVAREDLADALAALDVAVQPAVTPYASPMKLVEYLAAGCATVAPDCANVRELVGGPPAALLCGDGPAPSADALRAAIVALLADEPRRLALGAAARARVEERGLFWEENVRRVEEELALLPRARVAPLAALPAQELPRC